jgi:hypothetical protein
LIWLASANLSTSITATVFAPVTAMNADTSTPELPWLEEELLARLNL